MKDQTNELYHYGEPASYICPTCLYADRGSASWPCRCCSRINMLEDHYTPADGEIGPTNGDEIRGKSDPALARFLRDKLKITCGNCPAEPLCISKYPKGGGAECLDTITEWLKQGAVK